MEEFIGTIQMFAGNFAPRGWMLCQGQKLEIRQFTALFAVLGTTYGGDGQTYFNLPDLRGRIPMGTGKPEIEGTNMVSEGQIIGNSSSVITKDNIPELSGTLDLKGFSAKAKGKIDQIIKPMISIPCNKDFANDNQPQGKFIGLSNASDGGGTAQLYSSTANAYMKSFENNMNIKLDIDIPVVVDGNPTAEIKIGKVNPKGLSTYQPSLGINFIICIEGVFPPRP